jgi:hypothetical protein
MSKSDWRSGSSDGGDSSVPIVASPAHQRSTDRDVSRKLFVNTEPREIHPDDAQSIYPPSCCIFVAK